MTLQDIYNDLAKQGYQSDKGTVHSYLPVYEDLFAPYRNTAINILEIGLWNGDSLRMWSQYFYGNVYGIDCDVKPHNGMADLSKVINEGYNVRIADATNKDDIDRLFLGKTFDIVIDDGNHSTGDQIKTFDIFKNRMSLHATIGSLYIIEDPQDLDNDKEKYLSLYERVEIVDRRSIKGRYDDALIIIYI